MYKVMTYEISSGFFGVKTEKADKELSQFINDQEAEGWEFVSLSEMNTGSRSFVYKMVFKK